MSSLFKKAPKEGVVRVEASKAAPVVGVHSSADAAAILGVDDPEVESDHEAEDKAAGKIQRFWKKKKSSSKENLKPVAQKAATAPAPKPALDEDTAATKIQSFFRKKKAQKEPELPRPVGGTQPQVLVSRRTVDDEMAAFEKALAEGPPKFEEEAATASPAPTLTEDQAARKIQRAWRKHETYPELELKERQTDEAIISKEIASELRRHIPRRLRNSPHWTLLYSLTQHGSSMSTLYRNLLNGGPVFLSIKTTKGKVFGAFVSEQVRVADDGKGNARAGKTGGYYGTGESFLWRVLPKTATADGSTTEHPEVHTMKDGSRLWLHEASMDNDYFISTQQDCIILGGGGKSGAVALYIAADLFNGYSDGSSPTYNLGGIALGSDEDLPENLTDPEARKKVGKADFQIALIEIWGFARDFI